MHINLVFLLACLPYSSFGLLKSQDGPLVASPETDVVYLIQAPRSAFTISQAPLNVKVEAWLRANQVNYVSISSMVFLGSSSDGSVPFAEMNGQKLIAPDPFQAGNQSEGSNAVIQRVAEHFNLTLANEADREEESRVRRQIDYDLFNTVVMYTRSSTYRVGADGQLSRTPVNFNVSTMRMTSQGGLVDANGTAMRTGLDFMLQDASIREDMFALLVDLATTAQRTLLGVALTRPMVHQYYDARQNGSDQAKQAYLEEGGWAQNGTSWDQLDRAMQQMCTAFLINRLLLPQGGALDNAKGFLNQNTLDGRPVSSYNESEIVCQVQQIYGQIAARLAATGPAKARLYLFGNRRSPADCSLFGSLVSFFGIPLTVPAMVDYMNAVLQQPDHPHHILVEFFEQMKAELGMADVFGTTLVSRPWPLNWESQAKMEFERQMQDVVWAAAKRAFAVGATSSIQIGNEH